MSDTNESEFGLMFDIITIVPTELQKLSVIIALMESLERFITILCQQTPMLFDSSVILM